MWRTLSQQHPGELDTLGMLASFSSFEFSHGCMLKWQAATQELL